MDDQRHTLVVAANAARGKTGARSGLPADSAPLLTP